MFTRRDINWRRQPDGTLTLHVGRRTTVLAAIIPDASWPAMYRIKVGDNISDMVNLSRAREAALLAACVVANRKNH